MSCRARCQEAALECVIDRHHVRTLREGPADRVQHPDDDEVDTLQPCTLLCVSSRCDCNPLNMMEKLCCAWRQYQIEYACTNLHDIEGQKTKNIEPHLYDDGVSEPTSPPTAMTRS